jgi:hypothetical protein
MRAHGITEAHAALHELTSSAHQLHYKALTFTLPNAVLRLQQQQLQLSVPELLGRDSAQHVGERSAGALACLRGTSSSIAAMTDSAERDSSSSSSGCMRATAAMTDSAEYNTSSSGSAGGSHSSAAHVTRPKVTPIVSNCQAELPRTLVTVLCVYALLNAAQCWCTLYMCSV